METLNGASRFGRDSGRGRKKTSRTVPSYCRASAANFFAES